MVAILAQAAHSSHPGPTAWSWILGITAVVGLITRLATRKKHPRANFRSRQRGGDTLGGPGSIAGSALGHSAGPGVFGGSGGFGFAVGGAAEPDVDGDGEPGIDVDADDGDGGEGGEAAD